MSAPSDIVQALADRVETALGEIADQAPSSVRRAVVHAIANTGQCDLIAVVLADPDLIGEDLKAHADEIAGDLRHALSISRDGRYSDGLGALVLRRILAVARRSLYEDVLGELTHRQDTAEERAEQRRYYDGADELYDRARDEHLTSQSGCVSPEDAGVRSVGPA